MAAPKYKTKPADKPPEDPSMRPQKDDVPKESSMKPLKEPPVEPPEEPPKAGLPQESLTDYVLSPFRQWYDFIRPNWKDYWPGLLKISLASFFASAALSLLLVLIVGGLVAGALYASSALKLDILAALALGIPLALVLAVLILVGIVGIAWVKCSIANTAVVYTDARLAGKAFGIRETFDRIKEKVFEYLLVDYCIRAVGAVPLAVAEFFMILAIMLLVVAMVAVGSPAQAGSSVASVSALVFVMLFMVLFMIFYVLMLASEAFFFLFTVAFGFIAQFWAYGFLIEGLGVVEALKRSFAIVKKRPGETVLFYLVWLVCSAILWVPLMVLIFLPALVVRFSPYILQALGVNMLVSWLVFGVLSFVLALVVLVLSSIAQAFTLPTHYLFWKKVREG